MPYYIFRKHILPEDIKDIGKKIYAVYIESLKKNDTLMTSFDMNRYIRKKYKRSEMWEEYELSIRLSDRKHLLRAVNSESIDQFWLDIKPNENDYNVIGSLSFKPVSCPICMESSGFKIKLQGCPCIFHKKCIQQWVKYSDTCPVCKCTINKKIILRKPKCRESENDNEPLLICHV